LVDDVLAWGGHLRAADAFLTDCGANVIVAVCVGRADDTQAGDLEPFKTRTDILPDFVSDPDWLLPEVIEGVEL
jgi:adenine/guanine phosphoribosyltransferase-like PRPP-binding protein